MPDEKPRVRIVAFADEYSRHAEEHLEYFGKRHIPISIRSFSFDKQANLDNLGALTGQAFKDREGELKAQGIVKNMIDATDDELREYQASMDQYDVEAWDIGSPLGKQCMGEPDFHNSFLSTLAKTVRVAKFFGTRLIRSFTFYPGTEEQVKAPGADLDVLWNEYRDRAYYINDTYQDLLNAFDLEPVLEVESKLFGHDAKSLDDVAGERNPLMCFDGGNMVQQDKDNVGLSYSTFTGMADYLACVHVKDMKHSSKLAAPGPDEDAEWPYVPVGEGAAQYDQVFADLKEMIPGIQIRLRERGLKPEVAVVLEPHLICGGQFGGFTGRRMDDALDALTKMLDNAGIGYQDLGVHGR